ncbi:MAG: cytochrome c biogenesis protein ResB [Nitriliruptorales bacterium]|nr:cytochrome c biogenesis protein ResB [Nitriliruptorales bacterium]
MSRPDSSAPPEANPDLRRPGDPRSPGPRGFVADSLRMAWRWLTRMRTALYLLGVLAVLTVIATVVPQEPNVPTTVRQWRTGEAGPGEFGAQLIDLIGGFDVYGSAIFLALLLLLFTSLTACLIPRYRAWWRLVRRSRPPRTSHLANHPEHATFQTDASPDQVLATARGMLADRRWRLREDDGREPAQLAAEKGHVLREGGSLVFHTSFYVLLIAIVAGQLIGFSGQVGIVEGESWAETRVGYWTYDPGRLWQDSDHTGFTMRLDEFHVDWHRDPRFGGQPSLFLSDVTITDPETGDTYSDTVGGNDPLVVDGMKIHQLDWGYAPRVVVEADGEVVHDAFLTLTNTDSGFWRGAVKAPAADPDVGLEILFWPYAPPHEDTGEPVLTGAPWADAPLLFFREFRGDLQLEAVQNVRNLDTSRLEETGAGGLRPGGSFELADGVTVTFPELRRWVGFQVSSRPAVPYLLLGSILVLIGLIPGLYAFRRRLWVAAERSGERTLVTVAGRAFQRPQAFEDEHRRLVEALREQLAGPTAATIPDDAPLDDPTPEHDQAVPR